MSINLEAGLTALLLSILFGLNIGLIIYSYRYASCRCGRNAALSFFSAIPSFFSLYTCCGGGLATAILFTTVGGLGTSILISYGRIFSAVSALLLLANIAIIYRRLPKVGLDATT